LAAREWDCTVSAEFELTSTATHFHLRESLQAKKGDQEFFSRAQVTVIARFDLGYEILHEITISPTT
jgi:hypothetical protein